MNLVGFIVLLAVIFIAAHAAGARLGPVTTSHSQVQYSGGTAGSGRGGMNTGGMNTGGMNTGGMNMSGMNSGGSP